MKYDSIKNWCEIILLGADPHDQVGVIDDGRVFCKLLVRDDLLVKLLCNNTQGVLGYVQL